MEELQAQTGTLTDTKIGAFHEDEYPQIDTNAEGLNRSRFHCGDFCGERTQTPPAKPNRSNRGPGLFRAR